MSIENDELKREKLEIEKEKNLFQQQLIIMRDKYGQAKQANKSFKEQYYAATSENSGLE